MSVLHPLHAVTDSTFIKAESKLDNYIEIKTLFILNIWAYSCLLASHHKINLLFLLQLITESLVSLQGYSVQAISYYYRLLKGKVFTLNVCVTSYTMMYHYGFMSVYDE